MDRIIEITVKGSYIKKDSKNGGVLGEGNSKYMRIIFDEGWARLAKKVTFWNAKGQNPVIRTLTADYLTDILVSELDYTVPIPPEPLEFEGELTYVIDGYEDGKRIRSLADTLEVNYAPMDESASESTDPTPTQAEQLQTQIDTLLGDITEQAIKANESVETAIEHANIATEQAQIATEKATEAVNASDAVILSTVEAKEAAQIAIEKAEEAKQSEEVAKGIATIANQSIEASKQSIQAAITATTKAAVAKENATNAINAATSANVDAKTAETAAKTAKSYAVGGTGTRTDENEDNAKYYASIAKAIAGEDIVTTPELASAVNKINTTVGEVSTKTELMWESVMRTVTDNPVTIDFDDLLSINNLTGGTWNKPRERLEV